ncbi:MAG: hypothetical protein ABGX16_02115 [Pirellulales bacterium]
MKTLAISQQAVATLPANTHPVFWRFVWKEFRMLRGFWLTVGLLGIVEQYVSSQLMFDTHAVPGWMFASAWGAAALYAVGASVTMFSAESEDGTREYLQQLPGRWPPLLAGKLTSGVVSALALAGVLCITGWMVAGGQWPATAAIQTGLAIGGVAVLETIAWGLFFSLQLRQPLLAAIATIGAASVGVQLAIRFTPNSQQAFTAAAYAGAVPNRLLLIGFVLVVDVWLAARWLRPQLNLKQIKSIRLDTRTSSPNTVLSNEFSTHAPHFYKQRRRMIIRLLWQTWHDSWKIMLAVVPLALFLMVGMGLPAIVMNQTTPGFDLPTALGGSLFLPALFGALVFRADQRSSHREFLAAHACRPRYLWLVRHMVWLVGLLMVGILINLGIGISMGIGVQHSIQGVLRYGYGGYFFTGFHLDNPLEARWSFSQLLDHQIALAWRFTSIGWASFFTAYSLGQLCSLLLRREVLAGFLALLISILLSVWVYVVAIWQLNPWWFVLPLGVGAMLASWLRMPGWLVGRNSGRAWLVPFTLVAIPVAIFALMLPKARLDQLNNLSPKYHYFGVSLPKAVDQFESQKKRGQKTADAYMQLDTAILPLEEAAQDVTVDGKSWGELPNVDSSYGGEIVFGENRSELWTPEQRELAKKLAAKMQLAYIRANQPVIEDLIELSQRPFCYFPVAVLLNDYCLLDDLKELLLVDAQQLQVNGKLDLALDRYLALLRIESHELNGQSTFWVSQKLKETKRSRTIENAMVEQWATHPDQTCARLREAIDKLNACPALLTRPADAILVEWQRIHAIVLGTELPSIFSHENTQPRWSDYLAWLANKLPQERQRALVALDRNTSQTLNYLTGAMHRLGNFSPQYAKELRQLVRQASWWGAPEPNQLLYDLARNLEPSLSRQNVNAMNWTGFTQASASSFQASTSFLVTQEFNHLGFRIFLYRYIDSEIVRRGLKLQLALLAYRLEHDAYPDMLSELVPEYIQALPIDPFSGEAFQYRPQGISQSMSSPSISANTPCFWSVGMHNSEPPTPTGENLFFPLPN